MSNLFENLQMMKEANNVKTEGIFGTSKKKQQQYDEEIKKVFKVPTVTVSLKVSGLIADVMQSLLTGDEKDAKQAAAKILQVKSNELKKSPRKIINDIVRLGDKTMCSATDDLKEYIDKEFNNMMLDTMYDQQGVGLAAGIASQGGSPALHSTFRTAAGAFYAEEKHLPGRLVFQNGFHQFSQRTPLLSCVIPIFYIHTYENKIIPRILFGRLAQKYPWDNIKNAQMAISPFVHFISLLWYALGSVVNDKINAGDGLQGADVATLAADDAALHLVVGQSDHGNGDFRGMVSGTALNSLRDNFAGKLIRLVLNLLFIIHYSQSLIVRKLLIKRTEQIFLSLLD